MKEDEFTELFKYMQDMRQDMDDQFEGVKRDIGRVYELLDDVTRRYDVEESERAAHAAQLDRHEESIDRHDQSIEKLDHRVSGLEARAA
ncbi:hypothetical protein GCM10027059_30450 [Myceligenerans halotolerans]